MSPGDYLSGTVCGVFFCLFLGFFVCFLFCFGFGFFTAIGDNVKCDTAIVHNLM